MLKMTPLWKKYSLQEEPKKLLLPLCSLDYIKVDWKTDPLQEVKKNDTDQALVKWAMLATIQMLHPE